MKILIRIVGMVVVGVIGLGMVGVLPAHAETNAFTISGSGPVSSTVGTVLSYVASIGANNVVGLGDIVDLEIHDGSGQKVYQQFFTGQDFAINQTRQYAISWTPPSVGAYTFSVGVFSANWSTLFLWKDGVVVTNVISYPPPVFTVALMNPVNSLSLNQISNFTVNVKDQGGAMGDGIVDFEIYDATNQRVYQQFFAGQNFNASGSQSYAIGWKPTTPGVYRVAAGVFGANWVSQISWIQTVGMMTVAAAQPQPIIPIPSSTSGFYVEPVTSAGTQAALLRVTDPVGAARMNVIASQPQATWFGGWNIDVTADVKKLTSAAQSSGTTPILVAYNIPQRDCGGYSAGGATTATEYRTWINAFAAGIGARNALVVLEPDGLASMGCLSSTDQTARLGLLTYAVTMLKSLGHTKVYLDAGNPNWIPANEMAIKLASAGIASADGFSLNVSNFYTTDQNLKFGTTLSGLVGGKHFLVDVSRNGAGSTSDNQWCNPSGRALGLLPTASTGSSLADAFLWLKRPGESDGACNGGPSAGTWWPTYAMGLVTNAGY